MRRKIVGLFFWLSVLLGVSPLCLAGDEESAGDGQSPTAPLDGKEEVFVVSATRIRTPVQDVGSSVSVVSSEEIQDLGTSSLGDVLRTIPSMDVVRSGGDGQASTVMIRGAKSEHTLVLIDGVEVNDPSSPGRVPLLGSLNTDAVDHIEIVRGPQSTLFGSDAMGGVVNIITKKGSFEPIAYLEAEGASHNTLSRRAFMSGEAGTLSYMASISLRESDGISAASRKDGNKEKDGFDAVTFAGRLGWRPSDTIDAGLVAHLFNDTIGLDTAGGPGGDDPNYEQASRQFFLRPEIAWNLLGDAWRQRLGISLADIKRDYRNDTDDAHPDDSERGTYKGKSTKFDWQSDILAHETNTVTFGAEYERETMSSFYESQSAWGPYTSTFEEKSARTVSFYAQDSLRLFSGAWCTTLGGRLDDHDRFGSKTTFRATTSFLFPRTSTRVKGSFGTAFKAPTLFQLYSSYGNKDLDPENLTGWDAGIEQGLWGGAVVMDATYFHNTIDDLIDFDSLAQRYKNTAEATSEGLEASVSLTPVSGVGITAAHTITRTQDEMTGKELLRRPKNKSYVALFWRVTGSTGIHLDVDRIGSRDDVYYDTNTWSQVPVRLDPYTLVNLSAWYETGSKIRLWIRLANILNEDYEEVWGYQTEGRTVSAGMRVSL